MSDFTSTLALGKMIASFIFTPLALMTHSDRGIRIGAIAYLISSLAVQELNPRTRSLNRQELEGIDCQRFS